MGKMPTSIEPFVAAELPVTSVPSFFGGSSARGENTLHIRPIMSPPLPDGSPQTVQTNRASSVRSLVEDVKASGFVKAGLDRSGQTAAAVAPKE